MRRVLACLTVLTLVLGCDNGGNSDTTEQAPSVPGPVLPPEQQPTPGGGIVEQQQFMVFHNLKRCWHDAPDIKWNESLAQTARNHAATCSGAKDPLLDSSYGESVALGAGLDVIKAQDNWYIAGIFYPYGQATGPDSMAEFSQMVWRSTEYVGCASASCASGNFYVCRYYTKGNTPGSYADNVHALTAEFYKCSGMSR